MIGLNYRPSFNYTLFGDKFLLLRTIASVVSFIAVNELAESNQDCSCYSSIAIFASEGSYKQNV